jgi:hypothetical protein
MYVIIIIYFFCSWKICNIMKLKLIFICIGFGLGPNGKLKSGSVILIILLLFIGFGDLMGEYLNLLILGRINWGRF